MATKNEKLIILDVRTEAEYRETHLKGCIRIDINEADFQEKILKLDKSRAYKVYCRSGNRSGRAMELMKSWGFVDVENAGSVAEAARTLNVPCEGE